MTPTYALLDGFMSLFHGRRDRYGTGKGWNKGVEFTDQRAADAGWRQAYAQHLAGDGSGLGIFPLLDDGTVWFGAIDLDEPDFEAAEQMQRFLPGKTWLERSRSGNAHVWVFFSSPIEAWAVRAVLGGATKALGKPRVEIFPKQDRLLKGMVGNFINLPYHGDERPIITGGDALVGPSAPIPVGFFVDEAMASRTDPERWMRRAVSLGAKSPAERGPATPFGTSPTLHRCAEHMMERDANGDPVRPVQEGARHQAVFAMAKMLHNVRDMSPAAARSMLEIYNDEFVQPPIEENEFERSIRNVLNMGYTSTGCDDPLLEGLVDPECPIASGKVGSR